MDRIATAISEIEAEGLPILCAKALGGNDEFKSLQKRSVELFNAIKEKLKDDRGLIFEYEDVESRLTEIMETICFGLGKRAA